MYLVLTDLLTCPRCGPEHGLIVLADRIVDRRILAGTLGCPNCEANFGINSGVADLRQAGGTDPAPKRPNASEIEPMRLAAMLGVTQGPAYVLLLGTTVDVEAAAALLVPGLELIVLREENVEEDERTGVSRLIVEDALPLRGGSLRAALVGTGVFEAIARDAVRVVAIGARLVVAAEHIWLESLVTAGELRVLARDAEYVVTVRQR